MKDSVPQVPIGKVSEIASTHAHRAGQSSDSGGVPCTLCGAGQYSNVKGRLQKPPRAVQTSDDKNPEKC